jgi:NAD(P)-dependent dehydrogenase (short-subunit alcohol dehydrogenase family)
MRPLDGKNALVTGGSRGIGAAIALAFAEAGANVFLTYSASAQAARAVTERARAAGVKAAACKADAGQPDEVRRSLAEAAEFHGGRLDILVNNAGIFKRRPLHEASDEDFDAVMAVNLRGVFIACKEAVKLMPSGGRIINLGSSFGARVPMPGLGLYAISKFAVAGLTRALARDLAAKGITVNAIQPGPIATDMNPAQDRHSRIMAMMTALGRYGAPEDVAQAALFLALPQSGYVTGTILPVDGGFES